LSNPYLEILIIVLLILVNGVLAMSEIAIVSARKSRLQEMAEKGNSRALAALRLAERPNQFLATVQFGITLVGILAGAYGGATVAKTIAFHLSAFPEVAPYAASLSIAIVVIAITILSLILGELVPKRLALNKPEAIAAAVAGPMQALSTITAPVVKILSVSTDFVIRILGVKPSNAPPVTLGEIRVLIEQGTESGVFHETEQEMIESVLRLDEKPVSAFMTPRTQIVAFDLEDTTEDIHRKITTTPHSRFPVVRDNLDDVRGIVRAKDLLAQSLEGRPFDLQSLLRPPLFVPENITALKVLGLFKERGLHVALVTDEYGGIHGMVTHHDVLEAIVGDIPAAGEKHEPEATRRDDGSYLVDGMMHVDRLIDLLELPHDPAEEEGDYQTVGGLVMSRIGTIPEAGQKFMWRGLTFEVMDMDGRRVDKVLVTPQNEEDQSE
jgi:putative hemolysin